VGGAHRRVRHPAAACAAAVLLVLVGGTPRAFGEAVGAVGGVASPAVGVIELSLDATDGELGLAGATATLDGVTVAAARFTAATCAPPPLSAEVAGAIAESSPQARCPTVVTNVALAVDTRSVPDGPHQLVVSVTDGAGNLTTLLERTITVANTQAAQPSSVTLALGSGAPTTGGSGAGGGGGGNPSGPGGRGGAGGVLGSTSTRSTCASPRLSMVLAQRPLRVSRGVVVLRANRRYRYTGRLTCLLGGRRVAAPVRTAVEVIDHVGRRTIVKRATAVRAAGRIVVMLAYSSSRTILFEAPASNGAPSVVRIPIKVVRARKSRRG
jgi:hypothetical protein